MRFINRQSCPPGVTRSLAIYNERVAAGKKTVEEAWDQFRATKAYQALRTVLEDSAGFRGRCFYCSDSLGVDIEHYRPKVPYPDLAFSYGNLLLICSGCNRLKGDQFPLDASGLALMIDPTHDDPWDSLFFEDLTGLIVPRIAPVASGPSGGNNLYVQNARATATLSLLNLILNRTATSSGRARAWLDLVGELTTWAEGQPRRNAIDAIDSLRRRDDYGLIRWMLLREGAESPAVRQLRLTHPEAWGELRAVASRV